VNFTLEVPLQATPYFGTEYTFAHLDLEPELRGNISMECALPLCAAAQQRASKPSDRPYQLRNNHRNA
jgi:hypothetical protein